MGKYLFSKIKGGLYLQGSDENILSILLSRVMILLSYW